MRIRKAVGAIIKQGEKYLLVNKIKNNDIEIKLPKNGEWDFVKGGIKENETLIDALAREMHEELGINQFEIIKEIEVPLVFSFSGNQKNKKYDRQITYFFVVDLQQEIDDLLINKTEILQIKLVEVDEAVKILTHNETRDYLKKYLIVQ